MMFNTKYWHDNACEPIDNPYQNLNDVTSLKENAFSV